MVKKKVYQDVNRSLEWDSFQFGQKIYSVVRVHLYKRDGKPIFKEPILLITNISLESDKKALRVYTLYLHRSKIEGVFTFLKETLGWEEFQLRHFEAIKNLVAFCFFIGAYFYEMEEVLIQRAPIQWICQLGGGKGKTTRHFLFKELEKILIYQELTYQFDQDPDFKKGLIEELELMGIQPPF